LKKIKYILAIGTISLLILSACSSKEKNTETMPAVSESVPVENTSDLTLVLSHPYEESGQNISNNDILKVADELLQEEPDLGVGSDVSFNYTGYWYEEEGTLYDIFLFVNRSGQTLTDFDFTVSLSHGDQPIFDQYPVKYREKEFNTLPDKSVIAVLLPVDEDKATIVKNGDENMSTTMSISDIQPIN